MILGVVSNKNIDLVKQQALGPVVFANARFVSSVDFEKAEEIFVDNSSAEKVEELKDFYKGIKVINIEKDDEAIKKAEKKAKADAKKLAKEKAKEE